MNSGLLIWFPFRKVFASDTILQPVKDRISPFRHDLPSGNPKAVACYFKPSQGGAGAPILAATLGPQQAKFWRKRADVVVTNVQHLEALHSLEVQRLKSIVRCEKSHQVRIDLAHSRKRPRKAVVRNIQGRQARCRKISQYWLDGCQFSGAQIEDVEIRQS